jgi:hypothetical protein
MVGAKIKNPVQKCRALAHKSDSDQRQVHHKLETIEATIERAQKTKDDLFGIEQAAKPALVKQIEELQREKERLLRLKDFGDLPCLSLEPLAWRDKSGRPRLVLFGLDSPNFVLAVNCKANERIWGLYVYKNVSNPKLPPALQKQYQDVFARLRKEGGPRHTITLSTKFTSVIPTTTKTKIVAAQKRFSQIFLLAEAQDWTVKKSRVRPKPQPKPTPTANLDPDPLVVGWDGSNLWLIDQFDLTTVEQYVKAEFRID